TAESSQIRERFVPLPQIQKMAYLNIHPWLVLNPYQTLRMVKRQRPQEHCVHHAEDSGTGANAETGNKNHKGSEAGIAPHGAERVAQIQCQIVDPMCDPNRASVFRGSCHIAKLSPRSSACFRLLRTLSDEVLNHRLDMEFHLFPQQALPFTAGEPILQ